MDIKKLSWKFRVAIVLIGAVIVYELLIYFKPEPERILQVKDSLLVETMRVKSENINMFIDGYGTVKPREVLKLVAEVSGKIAEINPSFKEGELIQQGSVLLQIDPRTYKLDVDKAMVKIAQAEAELKFLNQEIINLNKNIEIAKSDLALSKSEYLRIKKLAVKKVVSQSSIDKVEQTYLASLNRLVQLENKVSLTYPKKEGLKAQKDMAVVLYSQAKLYLQKTLIIIPYDGWVLDKEIEKGQHVHVGQYIGSICKEGKYEIEMQVANRDMKWLLSDLTQHNKNNAEIFFKGENISRIWQGRVVRIKAQIDERTRTLPVIVEIDCNRPTMSKEYELINVNKAINIRAGRSEKTYVVKKTYPDVKVKVGPIVNNWRAVFDLNTKVDDETVPLGYVYAPLLKSLEGSDNCLWYANKITNIRAGRSIESDVVKKLYPGIKIKMGSIINNWCAVFDTDTNAGDEPAPLGYVYAPLLNIVENNTDVPLVYNKAYNNRESFHLRSGMFVTVKIKGVRFENIFRLPRNVVHAKNVVYLFCDGYVKIQPVNILRHYKEIVFVDKGLSEKDFIITTPVPGAVNGMKAKKVIKDS